MTAKRQINGFMLILGMLVALVAFATPSASNAAVIDECADGKTDEAIRAQSAAVAQQMMTVSDQIHLMFGAIDIRAEQCIDTINNFLNSIMDMELLSIDPFSFIITQLGRIFIDLLNQLCNYVVSSIKTDFHYLLSQLNRMCIPLPNLVDLNLTVPLRDNQRCNGIPTITLTPAPAAHIWDRYRPEDMLPSR